MVIVVSGKAITLSPAAQRNVTSFYPATSSVSKPKCGDGSSDPSCAAGGRVIMEQWSLQWDAWRRGWRRQEWALLADWV